MTSEKLLFIRGPLKLLGLSDEAIHKTIDFISDLLFEKDEKSTTIEYPYHLVDEFMSPAEHNFFFNLKSVLLRYGSEAFAEIDTALHSPHFVGIPPRAFCCKIKL